ncbi:hypothetical protein H4F49_07025 [Pectobacterium polaris]|nr:hypothetical protein [Pectobacterium polaris]MBN3080380.1 hypothetical protein [Pectobacterium polaris]
MTDEHDSTRRMLISALAGLTLTHVALPSAADVRNNPKIRPKPDRGFSPEDHRAKSA